MRVASFNILDGGTGRADPLAEILLAQRSDIICLLETQDPAVVERIAARLGMDFVRAGDEQQSATILSRWPIRETIDHAAVSDAITKSFIEAVVTDSSGRDWPIGMVHLHAGAYEEDERRREPEIAAVLDVFERHRRARAPHLLVGDFNSNSPIQRIDPARCKPATQKAWQSNGNQLPRRVIQRLLDVGYVDTLHAAHPTEAVTAATFTTKDPGQRVDYVFTFGTSADQIRAAWIEHDRLAKYASDHYPVGAEIA